MGDGRPTGRPPRKALGDQVTSAVGMGLIGISLVARGSVYTPQLTGEEQRKLEPDAAKELVEQRREKKEHASDTALDAAGQLAEDRERSRKLGREVRSAGRASEIPQRQPVPENNTSPSLQPPKTDRTIKRQKDRPRGR